jgi:hypothetical protein
MNKIRHDSRFFGLFVQNLSSTETPSIIFFSFGEERVSFESEETCKTLTSQHCLWASTMAFVAAAAH